MILLKFIQREYLQSFLNGDLYMNPLEFFAERERTDQTRSDPAEGADQIRQFKSIEIMDPSNRKWVPIGGLRPGFIYRRPGPSLVNVFCMYSMGDGFGYPVDERNFAFGVDVVALIDPDEFLRRVRESAEGSGRELAYRPVEYVKRDVHDGEMGPFIKLSDFTYQCEFRIALFSGEPATPYVLSLRDLRDICLVAPLREINERIRVERPPSSSKISR